MYMKYQVTTREGATGRRRVRKARTLDEVRRMVATVGDHDTVDVKAVTYVYHGDGAEARRRWC